jgi:transposase-like protein
MVAISLDISITQANRRALAMMPKRKEKSKVWSEAEKQQLVKMARQGATAWQVAAKLGRYAGSVRRMAKAMRLILSKTKEEAE